MSASMQSHRSTSYKGSRSSEGRMRLSTSCNECHRRKQKCDQKQPCKNCARRYPPPPCIYRRKSAPTYSQTNYVQGEGSGEGYTGGSLQGFDDTTAWEASFASAAEATDPLDNVWDFQVPVNDSLADTKDFESALPDTFEPVSAYQRLLTTMVSCPYKDMTTDFDILNEEKRDENLDPGLNNFVGIQRLRWNLLYSETGSPPNRFSISSVDPLHYLPLTPNTQNAQLFNIFVNIITKYVVSIDGNPSPNYYNDHWIPWAIKSPLLCQLGVYTAACYQAEVQRIPAGQSTIALGFKLKCIEMLNEMLRSKENSTRDETIAAVVYLITNEWYWGINDNVQAHLRGLRQLVLLRGGLESGMNPFLKQMIILCDYHMACSFDREPSFRHNIEGQTAAGSVCMSTPLLASESRFSAHLDELHISKETAMILDDMRFLTTSILKLGNLDPLEQDLTKLLATSTWIRDRICTLPDGNGQSLSTPENFIYRSCRTAALIYCKAIVERIPLSQACTSEDLNSLWGTMWHVTLTRWKSIPGIFIWIILSAHQAAQDTAYGRFLKSMLKTSSFYIALDDWNVVDGALMAFIGLQRWLRKGTLMNLCDGD